MSQEQILTDFLELVQIDAPSRKEREIAYTLKQKLEAIGCTVTEDGAAEIVGGDSGNVLAVIDGGAPGAVLFCAHMDRVSNGLGIRPIVDDGVVRTDGSTILAADDVAGIAAILDGLRRLISTGRPFPRIEVLFCVCEEAGLLGSRCFDTSVLEAKRCYTLDSPGRLGRIINKASTAVNFLIRIYGKSAHAGNEPEKGVDALKTAAIILATAKTGLIDDDTTANFPILTTSSKDTSSVCDFVEIKGGTRSHNPDRLDAYVQEFEALCHTTAEKFGARAEVETRYSYKGFLIPENSVTVQIAAESLTEMGIPVVINGSGGGMDANELNLKGIESVGIATGYSSNHTVREELAVEDLLRCGEFVQNIAYRCIE